MGAVRLVAAAQRDRSESLRWKFLCRWWRECALQHVRPLHALGNSGGTAVWARPAAAFYGMGSSGISLWQERAQNALYLVAGRDRHRTLMGSGDLYDPGFRIPRYAAFPVRSTGCAEQKPWRGRPGKQRSVGTRNKPRRPQNIRHASVVANKGGELNSRRHRYRWPGEAPDQPHDECDEASQKQEGQAENDEQPQCRAAAKGGDIAAHGSPGIAADAPAEHGQAFDVRPSVEAHVSAKRCRIASHYGVALHHNATAEGGDIAIDASANPHATTKAGHFRDFLIASDGDVVAELSSVVRTFSKGRDSESRHQQKATHPAQRTEPHRSSQERGHSNRLVEIIPQGANSWDHLAVCGRNHHSRVIR